MTGSSKTNQELLEENSALKQKIKDLEHSAIELKRVEEAFRKSEEDYRHLFDNSPSAIYQIDCRTGKLLKGNDIMCEFLGCRQEDISSISAFDVLTDESKQLYLERQTKIAAGEKVTANPEYEIVDKDGNRRWIQLNSNNIYDADGTVIGADVVAHEITDRKRIEGLLRRSEEYFKAITESASDILIIVDEQGTIKYTTPSVERILGYTPDELMGKSAFDFILPDDVPRASEDFSRALLTKEVSIPNSFRIRQKDGVMVILEGIGKNLLDDKLIAGFVMNVRDVTARTHAEEENRRLVERLNRAEKMEALGTLAGGVAHDLNNVLGTVVGFAELLLMEMDESNPIRPSLASIMEGGQRAAAIVQDLLTLARRGVPAKSVLNLNQVITECLRSPELDKLCSYNLAVTIRTDLEPDLLNVSGSSVHLVKSLYNLISNACEAMKKDGVVTIRTTNQCLYKPIHGYDQVRAGDYAVLTVSDTGEGIPAADLKRIFEPFYTKKVMGRSGTGLGLAVVWGTIQDHNGYINIKSEEGKGSIFTLYFPVTREDISAMSVPLSISEYRGTGESILVVDDVRGQRDLATDMLRTLNYSVTCVSSGEEAVAYLKEHTVDLVLLDMIMDHGMDGLDTYRSILEILPKQKAIIVSGFSDTERVHAAQSLGVGAYVRKPYVMQKLGMAIRKELNRK